jgi:hypothetical protein
MGVLIAESISSMDVSIFGVVKGIVLSLVLSIGMLSSQLKSSCSEGVCCLLGVARQTCELVKNWKEKCFTFL